MTTPIMERLRNISPRTRLFIAIVFVVVVADQISKYYAVKHLTRSFAPPPGQTPAATPNPRRRFQVTDISPDVTGVPLSTDISPDGRTALTG